VDSFAKAGGGVCGHSNEPVAFTGSRKGTDNTKRRIDLEHIVSQQTEFFCMGRWLVL
jgi:hypothetical protein